MGPPSYMRSIVDRNVVFRRMTVHCGNLLSFIDYPENSNCGVIKFIGMWYNVIMLSCYH